ncbi:MAG: sugar phosphate isomerase/epimerase [Planctomycetota bacterium]|nr:sugar phosphate isomerase/epimerase [Planctomycetota bacterium]
MMNRLTRRESLLSTGALLLGGGVASRSQAAAPASEKSTWKFCLNQSTLRGQMLSMEQFIDVAAEAGYEAIEPWINEIEKFLQAGGQLGDLKKRIADKGLTVASAIGFAQWIVDDEAQRAAGLEQARHRMDWVKQLGGVRIAAPPSGATNQTDLSLDAAGERYRALLDIGAEIGVTPQVEVWGFSKSLSKLGEVLYVAAAAGHPDACVLPDVYHLFKGGSSFESLKLMSGRSMHCFHMNDYPAAPPREEMTDAHRVYPGDGVAPLAEIYSTLSSIGFAGTFSLELFNREYWQQDALTVAKTGLEKMQGSVDAWRDK